MHVPLVIIWIRLVGIIKKLPVDIQKNLLEKDTIRSGSIPITLPLQYLPKDKYVNAIKSELFVDDEVFVTLDEHPEFIGGQEGLEKYINSKLYYPELARKNNIHGRVTLTFSIEMDGESRMLRFCVE